MTKQWHDRGRSVERREDCRLKGLRLKFHHRIDVVWLVVLLFIFIFFIASWLVGVLLGNRWGWFDRPLLQSLEDPRILSNIRDEIESKTILDAVYHPLEGNIYISRQGGDIYCYQPATNIWSNENPFNIDAGDPNKPDIVLLRSGNGTDAFSNRPVTGDPHSLWGLTANGGLVRRTGKKWQVLVHDTPWIGCRNKPVEHGDLISAAVSQDQQWLMVGTRQDGLGLYNLKERQWESLSPDFYKTLPSVSVTHLAWSQGRFWIGGPSGLSVLLPDRKPLTLQVRPEVTGVVSDMDVDLQDRLWVLEKRDCQGGGKDCTRLTRFQSPQTSSGVKYTGEPDVKVLMDERLLFPHLTLEDLFFARYWDNRLLLAGHAGVYSYDMNLHSWGRHYAGAVSACLPFSTDLEEGKGFYFGYNGGLGVVSAQRYAAWLERDQRGAVWRLPGFNTNQVITKLRYGRHGEALALDGSGNLYSFTPSFKSFSVEKGGQEPIRLVFEPGRTRAVPKRFRWASVFGDFILFTGPGDAMLHNIVTREYRDIGIDTLPIWLREPEVELVASGKQVYAIAAKRWYTQVHSISAEDAAAGRFNNTQQLAVVTGLVTGVNDWNGKGVAMIAGGDDGRVIRFSPIKEMLTGLKAVEMDNTPILDVAPFGNGMIIATPEGIRSYDYSSRTWGTYHRFFQESPPRELVNCMNRLFITNRDGQLIELKAGQLEWKIGGEIGFDMEDTQLSDVRVQDDKLYLAGSGSINLYNLSLRRITNRWQFPGKQEVDIVGIVKGQPLALSNGVVTVGTQPLDPGAGSAVNVFNDNRFIWTVRQKSGSGDLYLKSYAITDPFSYQTQCYFYHPWCGKGVSQVMDAKEIQGEIIATATDKGLRFYNPAFRTWYPNVIGDPIPTGGYLYRAGRFLVAVEPRSTGDMQKVTMIAFDALQFPRGNEDIPVEITGTTRLVRSLAVSPQREQIAYIHPNGSVMQWQGDKEVELLSAPGPQPESSTLKRVFGENASPGGSLLFTTNLGDRILHYNLQQRGWLEIPLRLPKTGDGLDDIDMTADPKGHRFIITAKTRDNSWVMASLATPVTSGTAIQVAPVFVPSPGFDHEPGELVDVQQRGGPDDYWTFVLQSGIKYFDPKSRKWSEDIILPGLNSRPSFCRLRNLGVVVAQGNMNWWVAQQKTPHPESFATYTPKPNEMTALDDKGTIWRFLGNGTLYRHPQPVKGNYIEDVVPYEIPFVISPLEVIRAFEWDERVVFDTRCGLRVWDGRSGRELKPGIEAESFQDILEVVPHANQLWLRTKNDQLGLLVVHPSNSGELKVFPAKVEAFVRRRDGRHWVRFVSSTWQYWNLISFESIPGQKDIRFWVTEGMDPAGIDSEGRVYWWTSRLEKENGRILLPTSLKIDEVKALWRGQDQDWWVINSKHIYRFTRGNCQNPDYRSNQETPGIPERIDCFKMEDEMPLPDTIPSIASIRLARFKGKQSLEIDYDNGERVTVEKKFLGSLSASAQTIDEAGLPERLENRWEQLKGKMAPLPNGEQAFNPVIKMEVNQESELVVHRPGSRERLAVYAAIKIDNLPPALDAGWLKWSREKNSFNVQVPGGMKSFSTHAFIRERQFIFEEVDALTVPEVGRVYSANRYGIWQYNQEDIRLNDPGICYRSVEWNRPQGAAHGYFYTYDRVYKVDGTPVARSDEYYRWSVGDVLFSEPVRTGGVTGRIAFHSLDNGVTRSMDAFAANGFVWDRNRQGLAFRPDGLMVQSDAGIHPVSGYSGFEAVPASGRLVGVDGETLFFQSGNTWYRRDGSSQWTSGVGDPFKNRVLVNNRSWKWELRNGLLQVALNGRGYDFQLIPGSNGMGFSSDFLKDAGTFDNQLLVMSGAFLEVANPSERLSFLEASRQAPMDCQRLTSLQHDNRSDLILESSGRFFLWNPVNQKFDAVNKTDLPGQKPLQVLIPVGNPRLRFTRQLSGGFKKELRIKDINGNVYWVPFSFWQNCFPFDVITSVATSGERLYLGTRAGLQVYEGQLEFGLEELEDYYGWDSGESPGVGPTPVEMVGTPLERSGVIMAISTAGCIETTNGKTFQHCRASGRFGQRLRLQTDFWRFIQQNGRLDGQYKKHSGHFDSTPIAIRDGRFPHDRMSDLVIANGKVFTIRQDGWISVYPGFSLELTGAVENYDTRDIEPRHFILLKKPITFSHSKADEGVYVVGKNNGLWYYTRPATAESAVGVWQVVQDRETVSGVLHYSTNPPLVQRQRLRLLKPNPQTLSGSNPAFTFEYRGLDNQWRPMPWVNERVGIDHWSEFIYLENQDILWAATPLGMASFSRSPDGKVVLDPDQLVIIAEPRVEGIIPRITEMLLNPENQLVTLRCESRSDMIFRGSPTLNKDQGVFTNAATDSQDPFVTDVMVVDGNNSPWRWIMEGRQGNEPGKLKGRLHGEDVQLIGGRFSFDTVQSLAFFQEPWVEIGTEAGGWFRAREGDFHVRDIQRPAVPGIKAELVKEVRTGCNREGESILGLLISGQGYTRLEKNGIAGKTGAFPQFEGSDGFWNYEQDDNRLSVTSYHSQGGRAERLIRGGRFTDDMVLGLPVSVEDEKQLYYFVPTAAGVVRLNRDLIREQVLIPQNSDFQGGNQQTVLWVDGTTTPQQVFYFQQGDGRFYSLTDAGQSIAGTVLSLPPGVRALAAESGPQDFIRIRWENPQQRGWSLVQLGTPGTPPHIPNSLYVNLNDFEKYHLLRPKNGNKQVEPWMRVYLTGNHVEFLCYGADESYRLNFPGPLQLVAAIGQGKRLLVFGKTNLWDINLEEAMRLSVR